jgi:hypothetical protein
MTKFFLVWIATVLAAAIPAQAASQHSQEQPADQASQVKVVQDIQIAGLVLSEYWED